jgi:hypothetical protein
MEKLIFLHVPKSAGSTLQVIFRRQHKRDALFVDGNNPDLNLIREKLGSKNNIRLCFGHMDFGMHDVIGQKYKYATIIRDPIERVISQYYYVKRQPKHHLHSIAFKENNFSLSEYVGSGLSTELNNGQVRILIGAGGFHKDSYTKYDIPFGKCEPWMLEEAKLNIEKHFVLCGLQESFDESLVLMKKELGWRWDIGYVSRNITHRRKKVSELDEKTLKIIRDTNYLDIELYDWAKANFLLRVENEGAYIEKELRKLKWANLFEYYKDQTKNTLKKILKYQDEQ